MTATLTTLLNGLGVGGLMADADGDLFGTTKEGGVFGLGTVFELVKTPTGYTSTLTVLASFDGVDGGASEGSLFADAEGDLFGTTSAGPGNIRGSVFEIVKTPAGYDDTPGTVVNFIGANGVFPDAGLTADANGDLFGTAEDGGGAGSNGTLFEITRTGGSSTLVTFNGGGFNGADGNGPDGTLLVDANGDLFGTTASGGANDGGEVFELVKTPTGYASTPTILFSFAEDSAPEGLIADAEGDLFGTTEAGGPGGGGTVFEIVKTATGYAHTPTTLGSFTFPGESAVGAWSWTPTATCSARHREPF